MFGWREAIRSCCQCVNNASGTVIAVASHTGSRKVLELFSKIFIKTYFLVFQSYYVVTSKSVVGSMQVMTALLSQMPAHSLTMMPRQIPWSVLRSHQSLGPIPKYCSSPLQAPGISMSHSLSHSSSCLCSCQCSLGIISHNSNCQCSCRR